MATLKAAPNMAAQPDGTNIAGGGSNYFDQMSTGGDPAGFKYRNASVLSGLARKWQSSGATYEFGELLLASHTRHRQRITITVPAAPPANFLIYEVKLADNTTSAFQIRFTNALLLQVRDGTTLRDSLDVSAMVGDLIDLDIDLDGAGDLHVYVYTGATRDSTTTGDAIDDLTGALAATTFAKTWIGKVATVTGGATLDFVYLSEITSSEQPTPYTEPAPPGAGDEGNLVLSKLTDGVWVEQEILKKISGSFTLMAFDRIGDPEEPPGGAISTLLVPDQGCWWGAETPGNMQVGASLQGLIDYEGFVRTPDILHTYTQPWDGRLSAFMNSMRVRPGKPTPIMLHNTKIQPGASWQDIAAGQYDNLIDAMAAGLRQRQDRHFLTLWHEPEDNVDNGEYQEADYVAMWNHFVTRLRAQGVAPASEGGKTVLVWNMMGYRSWGTTMWNALVPDTANFDWVGWDPYATDSARYTTVNKMVNDSEGAFNGFYAYAAAHGVLGTKPFMWPEWGINHGTGGTAYSQSAEAAFVGNFPSVLSASFPKIKAIIHWPGQTVDANGRNYQLYGRTTAQAGYRAAANSAYFTTARLDQIPA